MLGAMLVDVLCFDFKPCSGKCLARHCNISPFYLPYCAYLSYCAYLPYGTYLTCLQPYCVRVHELYLSEGVGECGRGEARGEEGGQGGRGGGSHLDDIRGQGVHGSRTLHVMQHAGVFATAIHLAQSSPNCRLLLHALLLL